MKRVAIVGFGFMGRTHYGAWKRCRGAKVVAVCVTDLAHLKRKVEGNLKGVADNSRLPKDVRLYDDFNRLLADGGFDVVDLTTPTALHAPMAIAALKAGYHVLCEKPMALSLEDCDRMLAAAKRAQRTLFVAQCVRFFPEYEFIRNLVRTERYGKVIAADFSRFIAPPKWSPKGSDWFLDESRSGGVLFDVHVHDADYVAGTFGAPKRVRSALHLNRRGFPDHTTTTYFYRDFLVTSDSSFAASQTLKWEATGHVFFERATVVFGPFYRQPVVVYPDVGKSFSPRLTKMTGYEAEIRHFLGLLEGRVRTPVLTAKDARDSIALLLRERKNAEVVS